MLKEALDLAATYGFSVHPLRPRGKIPLLRNWPDLATTNEETIKQWWQQFPDANIGIATGRKSNIIVLDVDPRHGGAESLDELCRSAGAAWPQTLTVRTGSGGLHLYFRYSAASILKNSAGRLSPGLDIKTDRGQVVAPPSMHPNGTRYEWIRK